ncbi:MAG: lysostaphin resistance A-like protein [Thermoplasmatota archaeon]
MREYIEGTKLILLVVSVMLRFNGFVLIYLKRKKLPVFPAVVLNIVSPVLCMIAVPYVTSREQLEKTNGSTLNRVILLVGALMGSQFFSGLIFVGGIFLMGERAPSGRAIGPGAYPINFLPVYLLLIISISSLILLCLLRLLFQKWEPISFFKGRSIFQNTLLSYILLVPVLLIMWGYGWALGDAGFKAPTNPFMMIEGPWEIGSVFLSIVIIAPLVEELLFRGYLFKLLEDRAGSNPAVLVTASLFALAHFSIYGFIPILVMGGIMGWVRKRSGSIVPSLIFHSANNLAALLVVIL